jgi:hypothetical protein
MDGDDMDGEDEEDMDGSYMEGEDTEEDMNVTPQVFSSIIALHLHGISISMHHSCLLFYVM